MFQSCCNNCCLFCVSKTNNKLFSFNNRASVRIKSGIVALYENKILLVQSYNDKWGIPKGELELCENALNGAIREFQEETLINLKYNKFFFLKEILLYKTRYFIFLTILKKEQLYIYHNNLFENQKEVTGIGLMNIFCGEDIKFNLITLKIFKYLNKMILLENEFFRMFLINQITIMVVKKKTTYKKVEIKSFFHKEENKEEVKPKKPCIYFLKGMCKKGDDCVFSHQKQKKKLFCFKFQQNRCKFSDDECDFYHDMEELLKQECKFGKRCENEKCILVHNTIYCKSGISCERDNCIFEHTCKYNTECKKKDDCIFYHDDPKVFDILDENFPSISPSPDQDAQEIKKEEQKEESTSPELKFDTVVQIENVKIDPNFFEIKNNSDIIRFLETKNMFNFADLTFKFHN